MDWDFALRAGQFAFTALVGQYSLAAARRSSSKAEATQLEARLQDQHNRIMVLEQCIEHMPDSQQLAELAGAMKGIKAELAAVAKSLDPLIRSVDRINDYLLNART